MSAKELSKLTKLNVTDSENKEFPFFVKEWDDYFTESEILSIWKEEMDFANIIVDGEKNVK